MSIQIDVQWYVSGTQENGAWFQIQARSGGAQIGAQYTNTYAGSGWPTTSGTAATTSYFLTGTLPTAAQVVAQGATGFGAQIGFGRQRQETNYTAYVDFIRITVCYR